jgi:extracellular factor (EF) 3-hydroxypalmitic acid methyl ester biosynthesis protein
MLSESTSYFAPDDLQVFPRGGTSHREAALEQLKAACDEMVKLDRRSGLSPLVLLHATAAAMHTFAVAIALCETAGVERGDITPLTEPIRAMHAKSPFVHRLQTWPRGYPGDFETVELMCKAQNQAAAGTIAWAIEQYALHSPIAQQHRNKVAMQARTILATLLANPDARIGSLGCGGCRDLRMVQSYIPRGSGVFVLVDGDGDALAYARERLPLLGGRCRTVRGRVPRVLPTLAVHGPFDLIIAGGLFDYLPDRWAIATLREVRRLLAPGGRVVFSNIASGNPFRQWLEYLADWTLIERSHGDLFRLLEAAEFAPSDSTIVSDSTGLALMADVRNGGSVDIPEPRLETGQGL